MILKQGAINLVHKIYRILVQAVFPPKCLVCTRLFQPAAHDTKMVPGKVNNDVSAWFPVMQSQVTRLLSRYLCPACLRGLVVIESPICVCCGSPFKSRQGIDHHCGECIARPKYFRIARAPLVYEQVLTRVIHRFKYNGKIQLADPLAEVLLTAFKMFWNPACVNLILPVPLHLKKLRQRGFNQAYLLVRNWRGLAGQYFHDPPDFRIERDLLVRSLPTAPQSAFGRVKRAVNIKNAFELKNTDQVKDKHILLIDDVYTTGATVDECARLLLNSGVRRVDVLTLARAV